EAKDPLGTFSLANKIQSPQSNPRQTMPLNFAADPSDIDFVPSKDGIGYVVSRGGDVVIRFVVTKGQQQVTVGSSMNDRIDVRGDNVDNTCQNPIGGVVSNTKQRMFLNCLGSQRLAVLDLDSQTLLRTVPATNPQAPREMVAAGRRAFMTARG